MKIQELKDLKAKNKFKEFYSHIESHLPQLRRYIKQRLHNAEVAGIIPKGFFTPDDIIDDVYQEVFINFNPDWTEKDLKTILFKLAMKKLDEIIEKEKQKPKKVSIDKIIADELKLLDEKFTVNADGELVLIEELDDISYQQEQAKPKYLILERATEERILELLDQDTSGQLTQEDQDNFWKIYKVMPAQSKTVIELFVFGGLQTDEISDITDISTDNVEKIVDNFKQKLRKISKSK